MAHEPSISEQLTALVGADLSDCPFCGSQAYTIEGTWMDQTMWRAECVRAECMACIVGKSEDEVRRLWNRRHASDTPRENFLWAWPEFMHDEGPNRLAVAVAPSLHEAQQLICHLMRMDPQTWGPHLQISLDGKSSFCTDYDRS